jgi:hypothetical protein
LPSFVLFLILVRQYSLTVLWTLIRLKRIYNFLCSMLVYAPFALCFVYISWHFYTFSGTNLLTRCHSASSLFSAVLCFRKVTHEIFSELDETKDEVPIFSDTRRSPKQRRRGARGQPHQRVARATPWSCHQVVWTPSPPPDIALLPIYSPRRENPKAQTLF